MSREHSPTPLTPGATALAHAAPRFFSFLVNGFGPPGRNGSMKPAVSYFAMALALTISTMVSAQTVSVSDNASLSRALGSARAGAVIQLEPGRYRGGISAAIRGEKDRRVVIESADAGKPALIEGGTSAIQLSGCAYVTIRNLRIRGASGNGLNIDDAGKMDFSSVGIVVENIDVQDIGPVGNCDGIKLSGLRDFVVRGCTVAGWGGNAIDLVGCVDGVIEHCVVRGKKGFEPSTGPQIKGGSSKIIVRDCLFDHAAARAINVGGSTGLPYFRPRDAAYEASDITIENNVFIGGETPVAFVGVDGAVFRRNTIVDPGKWVLRILQETRGERFARCRDVVFERNIISYKRSRVRTAVNIGPDTLPGTFAFRENWWWCSDSPDDRPQLPTAEKSGVFGKDPQFKSDETGRMTPENRAAREYGASAINR